MVRLCFLGLRVTNFALTNHADRDARLVHGLGQGEYDGVAIGGILNGQNPRLPSRTHR